MEFFLIIFGFAAFCVLAGLINNFIRMRLDARHLHLDDDLDQRFGYLEERIEVLEKIVTDDKEGLRKEIESLNMR